MSRSFPISDAAQLPVWRRPLAFLVLTAIAMPLAFSTWSALLNNYVIERANFDGSDIGWLHTVREIPGFLAVGVIALLMLIREQALGLISLALLGVATAITAFSPTMGWILSITMLSSIGFHYYETVNQSLQLQWLPKERAPKILGWLVAAGSAATLVAYVLLVLTWKSLDLSFNLVFILSGGGCVLIAIWCMIAFPRFETPNPQRTRFVLRRRYWLYYLLQFLAGARRQIFVVFAGFMMVEHFGFEVHEVTTLFLINLVANIVLAPFMGAAVHRFGERRTLLFEYFGLILVFLAYGGIYMFGWGVVTASVLYVLDHLLFSLALALKTYFQKIADPGDIAPTAAVAFTINHIAAVFLPAGLGYLWLASPAAVFGVAAFLATSSFVAALLIPRHPVPGHETLWSKPVPQAAE